MAPTWTIAHKRPQTFSLKVRNVPIIRYKTVDPADEPKQFLTLLRNYFKNLKII